MENNHSETKLVGFIGVGAMGSGIVLNLLKSGYEVITYDTSPSALEEVVSAGAQRAASIADIGKKCRLIFLCLPTEQSVTQVVTSKNGLIQNLQKASAIIDTSSISALTSKALANEVQSIGCHYLDAPISGAPEGVRAGKMIYMVGATNEAFALCDQILRDTSAHVYHMGGNGAGLATKLSHNLAVFITMEAIMESIVLAERSGVDRDMYFDVLRTAAISRIMEVVLPRVARDRDSRVTDGHDPRHMNGVLEGALQLGDKSGVPLPLGRRMQQLIEEGIQSGYGDTNIFSWWKLLEERKIGLNHRV